MKNTNNVDEYHVHNIPLYIPPSTSLVISENSDYKRKERHVTNVDEFGDIIYEKIKILNLNHNAFEFPMNLHNTVFIYPEFTATIMFRASKSCINMRFEDYNTSEDLGKIYTITHIKYRYDFVTCMVSLGEYKSIEPFVIKYER